MAPRRFVEAIVVLESPHPLIRSPSGEGTGSVFFVRSDWLGGLAMASAPFVEASVVLEPPRAVFASPSGEGAGGVFDVRRDRRGRGQTGAGRCGSRCVRCVVAQFSARGGRARAAMEAGRGVTVRRSNRSVGTSPPLDCLPVWGGDGRFVLRSAVNERRSVLGAFCDVKLAAFTVGRWSLAVSFSMLGKGQRCTSRSAVHGRLSDDVVTRSPLCASAKRLKTAPVPSPFRGGGSRGGAGDQAGRCQSGCVRKP